MTAIRAPARDTAEVENRAEIASRQAQQNLGAGYSTLEGIR
jgi:hypothetical protein